MGSSTPTNISRLEAELCKHGFRDDGYSMPLHPDANDEGHKYYAGFMEIGFDTRDEKRKSDVSFINRYSEKAVEMSCIVPVDRLMDVAQVLTDNHKSAKKKIKIEVIVSVSTAVAVCEALRKYHD